MWTRADLKAKAKEDLKRSYWGLVLVAFIFQLLAGGGGGSSAGSSSGSSSDSSGGLLDGIDMSLVLTMVTVFLAVFVIALLIGIAVSVFVVNPIKVGAHRYFIEATYGEKTVGDIGVMFSMFKKGTYMNVVKVMFLKDMYVFLWSLLFIIPGIIKSYEYYMVPYILAENPDLTADDVFRLTKEMMDGNKLDTWVLELSFIGWSILAVFTCGLLAIFYVNPYMQMTLAHLYETLKHRASTDYYDHSLAGNGYAYSNSYGNPGAYAQANPYADPYAQPQSPNYASGEIFNPSAPVGNEFDDPYKLPEDNN